MFRYYAAYYLWWWLKIDRAFVEDFDQHGVTPQRLHDLLKKYLAIRTVSGEGIGRLQYFANALNQQHARMNQVNDAANLVHDLFVNLTAHYHRQFLSAISKAAWMRWRHPIAIYDRRARLALRDLGFNADDNYRTYHGAWMQFFNNDDTQNGLNDACQWLPNSHYAQSVVVRGGAAQADIDQWVNTDWFRNRIIDMRLFHHLDQLHPADKARFLGPGE